MSIQSYRDLDVWKKSIQLVKMAYVFTKHFPKDEIYGLVSQIRRSATSIPANIAEGRSRNTKKEFLNFLRIAYGSLAEMETHFIVAFELEMVTQSELDEILSKSSEIGRMLNGLRNSLLTDTRNPTPETYEAA